MGKLAINGGEKVRKEKFPPYLPIGNEEFEEVKRVFESHTFSRFLGAWHEDFSGGEQVQALEKEWAEFFGVKHAISVNSATSALFCAVGAIGIEPFDEVIVTPYSMSCSAVAPLIYSAIPIFADVEPDYFCLDPSSVEERISERTKAIIVVDLAGQAYSQKINDIAKRLNGPVTDTALFNILSNDITADNIIDVIKSYNENKATNDSEFFDKFFSKGAFAWTSNKRDSFVSMHKLLVDNIRKNDLKGLDSKINEVNRSLNLSNNANKERNAAIKALFEAIADKKESA